jgi:hypothetical protein
MSMVDEIALLSDKEMKLLLKQSLDFNAAIIALATIYMGNMDTLRARQKFAKEYDKQFKFYDDVVKELLTGVKVDE